MGTSRKKLANRRTGKKSCSVVRSWMCSGDSKLWDGLTLSVDTETKRENRRTLHNCFFESSVWLWFWLGFMSSVPLRNARRHIVFRPQNDGFHQYPTNERLGLPTIPSSDKVVLKKYWRKTYLISINIGNWHYHPLILTRSDWLWSHRLPWHHRV